MEQVTTTTSTSMSHQPTGEATGSLSELKVPRLQVAEDVTELIGRTPLLLLRSAHTLPSFVKVWGKLEGGNPGSSVKDRTALAMVLDAEERGLLRKGDTIVESTSGNLGHALAMIAVTRGYHFVAVVDQKIPADNLNLFKILGVETVFVNEKDEHGSTQANRMLRAREIARTRPRCINLDQYANKAAVEAHYRTTGPEIYEQLHGKVDVLVGTVGTASHLCGTAKFLKEKNARTCVIGVEPVGSVFFGGTPAPYLQSGNGSVFIPEHFDATSIDIKLKVSDRDALNTVREVARMNGVLFGGSSGSPLRAAFDYAKGCSDPTNIVVLLPDNGAKYMSTVYNDDWMRGNGLLSEDSSRL